MLKKIINLITCQFILFGLQATDSSPEQLQIFLKEYYASSEKTQKEYSKLLFAVEKNYREIAFTLLEKGEDPNYFCKSNTSPFLLSIFKEDKDLVFKMIQYGADVNTQKQVGDKIGSEIQYIWFSKISPLQLAAISNKEKDILFVLLNNGASIVDEKTVDYFNTALGISVRNGDWEKFEILVKYFNQNIQQIFFPDHSFLTICGSNFPKSENQIIGAIKIGEYLIHCGVPMETKHFSALSSAAGNGNIELMKALIHNGASVNFTPINGQFKQSPIFSALDYNKTIQHIKKQIKFKDIEQFFFKESLEIILKNGAKLDFSSTNHIHHISPLGYSLEQFINESIDILIQYGANPNYIDTDGKTALIRGIEVNNIDGVKLLLNLGANPIEKGRGTLNPIEIALKKGNSEIIDILIDAETRWYSK